MGYPGQGKTAVLGDLNSEKSYGVMPAHMNTVAGAEAAVHTVVNRRAVADASPMMPVFFPDALPLGIPDLAPPCPTCA